MFKLWCERGIRLSARTVWNAGLQSHPWVPVWVLPSEWTTPLYSKLQSGDWLRYRYRIRSAYRQLHHKFVGRHQQMSQCASTWQALDVVDTGESSPLADFSIAPTNPWFCLLFHPELRLPSRSLASVHSPWSRILAIITNGHTNPSGSKIVATLRKTFRFVIWNSGDPAEAVTVNTSSVLFHEIPSVFVIGAWPPLITISVACSSVGIASIIFGESEIHFLAYMLATTHSAFNWRYSSAPSSLFSTLSIESSI